VIDQPHGGPITIAFGPYEPDQSIDVTLSIDDVMVILEGRLSVSTSAGTVTANPGEIVYMPKGKSVTIRSRVHVALTAYVTFPHRRRRSNEPLRHHHRPSERRIEPSRVNNKDRASRLKSSVTVTSPIIATLPQYKRRKRPST
jgi:Ethanolamine utilisation protein EutQ